MRKITILLLVVTSLQGCATTLQNYNHISTANDGEVYIYKETAILKGAVPVVVYVDSKPVAKLTNRRFIAIPLGVGTHEIGVNGDTYAGENFSFSLSITPNSKTFYEAKAKTSQWLVSLAPPIAQIGTSPFVLEKRTESDFNQVKSGFKKIELK